MSEWNQITSFENLCRAARRAARAKRHVAGVARFLERLEPEALALQRSLRGQTWRPSRPTTFWITDPKLREITAAPFPDRVVHHALIGPLEPRLDAALREETFACRRNKGTHKALDHAQDLVRRHSYFLKLDIARCFPSFCHALVLQTLADLGLATETMKLVEHLLLGPSGDAQVGLPIGNLTSQWFANLVLGRIDDFVLTETKAAGYVRYMDDFVLFAESKAELRDALQEVRAFVQKELRLELKQRAILLAPVTQGLPFLGWRLYRGTRRLRPENARRTKRRLKQRRWELRQGRIDAEQYRAAVLSVLAMSGCQRFNSDWLSEPEWEKIEHENWVANPKVLQSREPWW